MEHLYGTCVEVDDVGIVLRGPPGSGKSDLALRLVDQGARLVADDQIHIWVDGGRLLGAAPGTIDGLMEVRGMGIITMPSVARVEIELVVDLLVAEDISRMPEPGYTEIAGVRLPLFHLTPFEASATAKLRLATRALRHDIVHNS